LGTTEAVVDTALLLLLLLLLPPLAVVVRMLVLDAAALVLLMNTGMTQLHNAKEERRTEGAEQIQQASKQANLCSE
jgi:hypothetical protein